MLTLKNHALAVQNTTVVIENTAINTAAISSHTAGSLGSLSGTNKFFTIKVPGRVLGQRVIVLMDSGATHNFIDER